MPQGSRRSRSLRRVVKKTPGGKRVMHYSRRKPAKPKCAECGALLAGIPRVRRAGLSKLSKTERRPSRPYGGVLCTKCTRKKMIARARS
ncbi:50S ribosomal protein L34e [Candidatus Woesearchaeota archaeon]|nr:50S ribosomal protein L34e [Candidatus Woesearchaeota archaeon]